MIEVKAIIGLTDKDGAWLSRKDVCVAAGELFPTGMTITYGFGLWHRTWEDNVILEVATDDIELAKVRFRELALKFNQQTLYFAVGGIVEIIPVGAT